MGILLYIIMCLVFALGAIKIKKEWHFLYGYTCGCTALFIVQMIDRMGWW